MLFVKPWLLRAVIVGSCGVVLNACVTPTPKPQTPEGRSLSAQPEAHQANAHYAKGSQLYSDWYGQKQGTNAKIRLATWHFRKALDAHPDNVQFQLAHYNALASAEHDLSNYDEDKLLAVFERLHPELKADAITPAFVSYSLNARNQNRTGISDTVLLKHILRAIEQNPQNPQNWLYTSLQFKEKTHYWTALASAAQARNIAADIGTYSYQMGTNLKSLADPVYCPTERRKYITKAASFFAEAAKKEQTNASFYAESSQAYLSVGLKPLAMAHAKKSYEIERNELSLRTLFLANFFSSRFEDAWKNYEELKSLRDFRDDRIEAMYQWHQIQSNSIDKSSGKALLSVLKRADRKNQTQFHTLLSHYLFKGTHIKKLPEIAATGQAHSDWDRSLVNVIDLNEDLDEELYLQSSTNICEQSRRLFYLGLRQGRAEKPETMLRTMRKVTQGDNYLELEDFWAHLITQTAKQGTIQRTTLSAGKSEIKN